MLTAEEARKLQEEQKKDLQGAIHEHTISMLDTINKMIKNTVEHENESKVYLNDRINKRGLKDTIFDDVVHNVLKTLQDNGYELIYESATKYRNTDNLAIEKQNINDVVIYSDNQFRTYLVQNKIKVYCTWTKDYIISGLKPYNYGNTTKRLLFLFQC